MRMPKAPPARRPLSGKEIVPIIQDDKRVLAETGDFMGEDGAPGVAGPPGPRGEAGERGLTGPQGLTGLTGAKGDPGERGLQGVPGVAGPQGERGVQGLPGATGSPGVKGDTGAQGVPGIQGPAGVAGPAGATGATGPAGTPTRIETYTATSNAQGIATFTFSPAFAAIADIRVKSGWVGDQEVGGGEIARSLTGCTIQVKRSRGTLLLTTGPFENAPNTAVSIVVYGR